RLPYLRKISLTLASTSACASGESRVEEEGCCAGEELCAATSAPGSKTPAAATPAPTANLRRVILGWKSDICISSGVYDCEAGDYMKGLAAVKHLCPELHHT